MTGGGTAAIREEPARVEAAGAGMATKKQDRLVLAMKRCIEDTFKSSGWDELAYLTDGKDIVYGHSRLLRSMSFGDEDYPSCIFDVLEDLIKRHPANTQIIADYIKLPEWLKENIPEEYVILYCHTPVILDGVEKRAVRNSFELNQHLERIRRSIESDPEQAVGSTKEMLESVLKCVLVGLGEEVGKDDFPKLLKRAQECLSLDPNDIEADAKGAEIIKRILSNLGQLVVGLNELRNLYGTGHGRTKKNSISTRHARLVVGSGATLATFLMETYEKQQQSKATARPLPTSSK